MGSSVIVSPSVMAKLASGEYVAVPKGEAAIIPRFRLLGDEQVLPRLAGRLACYRRLAADLFGYKNDVACFVPAGFNLIKDAVRVGPCRDHFKHLAELADDEENGATKAGILFCVPEVVPKSTGKKAKAQKNLLLKLEKQFHLPRKRLCFGEVPMLAGWIFTRYLATGAKTVLTGWVRTDTVYGDEHHLLLGSSRDDNWLECDWRRYGEAQHYPDTGCLAAMFEPLSPEEAKFYQT